MSENFARPVRWIGPYTEGEIPRPLLVRFDEEALDLTGGALSVTMEDETGTEIAFQGSIVWSDASIGEAVLTFAEADLELSLTVSQDIRRIQIWAGDGSTFRLATVWLLAPIYRAVGSVPAI